MPLFISSSDQNSNAENWLRTLIGAVVVVAVGLGAWEMYWRTSGFAPVIEDDLGIWAVKRRTVGQKEGPEAVLLGSSRMQLDVDPQIFEAGTGLKTVMLAIDGSSPLPVLEDLAMNSSFAGVVLCSLVPQWLADRRGDRGRAAKWVRKFHQQKWSSWIETGLSLSLQSHFVFRYPGLLPEELWENFLENERPRPPYAPMRRDRYRPADYTKTDIRRLRAARVERQREIVAASQPLTEDEFKNRMGEVEAMVRRINARGGRVVFLRLPSCGAILELEEKTWPRAKYWDRFAADTSAATVHYANHSPLAGFDCPDGSHLDFRDAERFTYSLVEVLAGRGIDFPSLQKTQ